MRSSTAFVGDTPVIDVVDPVGDTLEVGPVGGTPMMDVVGPEFDSHI